MDIALLGNLQLDCMLASDSLHKGNRSALSQNLVGGSRKDAVQRVMVGVGDLTVLVVDKKVSGL